MCDCQLGMSSLCFRIVHEIRISPGDRGYTIRVNMDSTQCLLFFFCCCPTDAEEELYGDRCHSRYQQLLCCVSTGLLKLPVTEIMKLSVSIRTTKQLLPSPSSLHYTISVLVLVPFFFTNPAP